MRTRRTWGRLFAALSVVLVAAAGFAPRTAWAADGDVAKVGDTEHSTVQAAIDSVGEGETATIELLRDVSDESVTVSGKDVTIDLSTHTLNSKGSAVTIQGGSSVTLKNGAVTSESSYAVVVRDGSLNTDGLTLTGAGGIEIGDNKGTTAGAVTIGGGTTITANGTGWCGVLIQGSASGTSSLVMNSGSITVPMGFGVSGNGSAGLGNTSIIINGGQINSTNGPAIYHPQSGSLVLNSGSLTGYTGIQLCSGKLSVPVGSSVSVTSTGLDDLDKMEPGDGNLDDGAAVSAINRGYPGGAPLVDIQGGKFTSVTGADAVRAYSWDSTTGEKSSWEDANENVSISGGTFSSDVTEFLADGMTQNKGEVVELPDVAEVDGVGYKSFEAAVEAAKSGGTVTLLADIEDAGRITLSAGYSITVDLNEHDITFGENAYFFVQGGSLTITGEGTVKEGSPYYAPILVKGSTVDVANYSVVNVGENVTLEGWSGLFIDNNNNCAYGVVANVDGTITSVLDTTGAAGHGIYVNGSVKQTSGNVPNITVGKTAKISSKGNGIYAAGYAIWDISGSVESESTGIEVRAGEVVFNEGSSVVGGHGEFTYDANGNGSTSDNVAIAIAQHTTKLPIKVTVNGGTFDATAAFAQMNPEENDQDSINKIEMSITGGEFTGDITAENFKDEEGRGFVSGGSFSNNTVGNYLAEGSAVLVTSGETPYDIYPTEEEALSNGGGHKVVDGQGNSWLFANKDAANDFAAELGDGAKVETVTRTVTFDDGTNKVAQEVVNGEPVEKPADPVRDDYTFKGWQTADGKAYDFSAPVTSDLTLTAAWEAIAPAPDEDIIEVTFMVGDKVHVVVQLHAGDTLAGVQMPAAPAWEGHTFVGWYAQVNEDGTVVESSKIDLEKTVFMTSTTLHAGFVTDGSENPVTPDVDKPEAKPAEKPAGLAQTSDPTSVAPLVASAVAGIGVVAGAVVLRRRNK